MKIIALLLARNESLLLPTYFSSVLPLVDEIIAINDRSTDNTKQILLEYGAKVFDSEETSPSGWSEFSARQRLLDLGRKNGGTHFVCLDADEAFSGNFAKNGRKKILDLKPGKKLVFNWPFLWKSPYEYVSDADCEFTNLSKDFVFCDHPTYEFKNSFLHFGKTPGPNVPENLTWVPKNEGVVLHFAYEDFNAALLRQAWYRCMELVRQPKNFIRINNRYFLPKKGAGFKTAKVPESWLKNIILPQKKYDLKDMWRYSIILSWFDQYGAKFFEPLEIWDIPELEDEFVKRVGRKPIASRTHIYLRPLIKLKRKVFTFFRNV